MAIVASSSQGSARPCPRQTRIAAVIPFVCASPQRRRHRPSSGQGLGERKPRNGCVNTGDPQRSSPPALAQPQRAPAGSSSPQRSQRRAAQRSAAQPLAITKSIPRASPRWLSLSRRLARLEHVGSPRRAPSQKVFAAAAGVAGSNVRQSPLLRCSHASLLRDLNCDLDLDCDLDSTSSQLPVLGSDPHSAETSPAWPAHRSHAAWWAWPSVWVTGGCSKSPLPWTLPPHYPVSIHRRGVTSCPRPHFCPREILGRSITPPQHPNWKRTRQILPPAALPPWSSLASMPPAPQLY
ncbi:hypothetical protein M441DRAFT_453626 [Trichoderma asperellum CBS 433.97]|uniref:Uncharacterized protein n=1 Tax=Trichoderma asperellum (strain ATCC 204424 / CBS 433.97 / NBRC 101777) TaxID=1042311 RepID=A0A2T3ZH03_TRIA4|nr:hypothetical protein M441DRAFT_453626 [Trichoderma asperellum CBS 433.97]PTB44070.1 hypothetical protein M441DRAFT_453626 [Trichoderma asperellum CBS 433.97]